MEQQASSDPATTSLGSLPVLAVDCQSTGANPQRGRLLEIAWARIVATEIDGGAQPEVTSWLVAQPPRERLPRRIASLTGIRSADLARARAPAEIWQRLLEQARPLALGAKGARGPLVAHFARFERAFLEDLHRTEGEEGPFPLELLCTHEIVSRLLPGLPRRGLRAVAGRFGHVLGGAKRAGAHVHATAIVWAELVQRLRTDVGVHTVAELCDWLQAVPAVRNTGRDYAVARAVRLDLPDAPGIYRMLAKDGSVLYLGKAACLHRRVNSYFQKRRHAAERTPEMLTQVSDVAVTVSASALEAALTEADEIKRLAPPYNVQLRARAPEVWFADTHFAEAVTAADGRHPIGPLPCRDDIEGLVALRSLLDAPRRSAGPAAWQAALGLPPETPFDETALCAGLAAFAQRHDLRRADDLGARKTVGLGARLWRFQQARQAQRKEARRAERERRLLAGEPERAPAMRPARDAERTVHDPARVVSMLEGTLLRCAHRVRRARWFRLLSESVLRWVPATGLDGGPARQLVLARGRLASSEDVSPGGPLPHPPGRERRRFDRQQSFDASTYDRLRVLTTELRRLVGEGRHVEISFGPRARLGPGQLERRLYWL